MFKVKILADSLSPSRHRLTTFELTYPRMIHSEFMTHRLFSRNSASSRAIPIQKTIEAVQNDPAMPVHWGVNRSGMQSDGELLGTYREEAIKRWLLARDAAVEAAIRLHELGLHKQVVNRVLEPYTWITVICSATEYGNFFNLRYHADAEPAMQHLAAMMWREYETNQPIELKAGEWHLPLIQPGENMALLTAIAVSAGRCARVSYLTHNGERDPQADLELQSKLARAGHWSPFEHQAKALVGSNWSGNFRGFEQYRKTFPTEHREHYFGPAAELA